MALIAASLTFIMVALSAVSTMAKGKPGSGGANRGTACSARLLSDGAGGISLLLETTDKKARKVDIYDDSGSTVLLDVQPDHGSAIVADANFVQQGQVYHAVFIQVSQKGDSIRCVADFGIPELPNNGG